MTTIHKEQKNRAVTEEQYIGFRKKPKDLETMLVRKECIPYSFRKSSGREQGSRYKTTDSKTGGCVYLLYQDGEQINPLYSPQRTEGNIEAVLKISITTGIIPGSSDRTLVNLRDTLVTHVLDTYRASAGAFDYIPQSEVKRETA